MKRAVFITARLGSTRLPSKHLLKINGKHCIEYVIDRAKLSKADIIVLCTTYLLEDDKLVDIARKNGIQFYRGRVKDKIDRWYSAAKHFDVDFFVTADGDDLFSEPELIDLAFDQYEQTNADLINWETTNIVCGSFTYGVKVDALRKINETKSTDDTEMMWNFFEMGQFNIEELKNIPAVYKRPEIRATLDYQEDYEFFKSVINKVTELKYNVNSLREVIKAINSDPNIILINQFRHVDWKNNQIKRGDMIKKNTSKYLGNELEYVSKVLNSEFWSATSGNWNQKLETEFSSRLGSEYAVCFNSGTSTLHAALEAVGVSYGDEVIIPALTVMMNTTSVLHANAVPVYADIDSKTFNIDPKDVERKVTPKTKAIVVVSLYGLPPDLTELRRIADKHNLALIEDNAQCIYGKCDNKAAGSFGDISSYSFENTKHVSCGEGGIIITNNEEYAEKCRKIGGNGFRQLKAKEGRVKLNQLSFQDPNYKRHDMLGWNYRMSEFCAAVALAQLERSEELVELRVKNAEIFINAMSDSKFFIPQLVPPGYESSYYTLGVLYEGDKVGISWHKFRDEYVKNGGDSFYGAWCVSYLEPMVATGQFKYRCPDLYKDLSYEKGLCPVAEEVQPKLMQFKTNYRNLDLANSKALILKNTIKFLGL